MMDEIKAVFKKAAGNIREAEEAEMTAIEWMSINRAIADWYHSMAQGHLQFNAAAYTLLDKLAEEANIEHKDSPLLPGMMARFKEDYKDLKKDAARAKAMTDIYGKM